MATQRWDVTFIPGESRSNVGYRIATGPLDEQGSRMTFGDAKLGQGPDVEGGRASDVPGRVLVYDNGVVREAQLFFIADPVYLDPDIPVETAKRLRRKSCELFPAPRKPLPPEPEVHDDEDDEDPGIARGRKRRTS